MSTADSLIVTNPVDSTSFRMVGVKHSQPGTKTGFIGASEALRIIWRRRWMIGLVIAFFMTAAVIFLLRTQPVYTTTTTVMVQPATPQSTTGVVSDAPTLAPSASEETNIQSKVELLQSRSLARQTALSLQLQNDREFAPPLGAQPGLLDRLFSLLSPSVAAPMTSQQKTLLAARAQEEAITDNLVDHISVNRIGRSNVISISASSVDPQKAARIANRLVDTYMRDQIDDARDTRTQQIAALSKRVAEVRSLYTKADAEAAAYRHAHGLLNSSPEASALAQTTQIGSLLAQARADSASDSRKASPITLSDGGISASSTLLVELRQQESILTRKLSELGSFYGPGYPDVAKTQAELDTLHQRIAQETARLSADLQSQASASQAKSSVLGASIAGLTSRTLNQGEVAVPLRAIERNAEAINTLYATLLNQLNSKIGLLPDIDPDISRISRAPVMDTPSFPIPKRILAIVFGAAAAIGTMLAFLVEAMDTKLRTSEQVRRLLGVPTLAMIPEMDEEDGPVHSVVADRPRSRYAEAVRNLLIEVEARTPGSRSRVVVITSPLEGEGKNTIAASLAGAAAAIGRNAVVVDFDLRRRGGSDIAGVTGVRGPGVVAYLANRSAEIDDLLVPEDRGRFATIGVGPNAPDPGSLIVSPRLPELVEKLRERFDLVILNAPPVLPVRDAKTLASHADATLMVLRWGRTSPEAAAAAMEMFDQPITGAVLNRVNYAVHAKRRYGDAIHHVSLSSAYFEPEPSAGRWAWWRRTQRWGRRTAETLHLA